MGISAYLPAPMAPVRPLVGGGRWAPLVDWSAAVLGRRPGRRRRPDSFGGRPWRTVPRRCQLVEFFVIALLTRQRPESVGGRHYAIHGCATSPLTLRCVYRRVQDLLPTVDRR